MFFFHDYVYYNGEIMSDSPIRRFSTASPTNHLKREETLINAYEAEEERIINVLSRKLEQVRPCGGLGETPQT